MITALDPYHPNFKASLANSVLAMKWDLPARAQAAGA
jgi:hypothetical protein